MDSTAVKILLIALLLSGCGLWPEVNKSTPTPTPGARQNPTGAVEVTQPTNVSFSTYSKEWPVGWQWEDPDFKYKPTPRDVKKGVLRISIPTGKDLYGETRTAPRYIKPITGDFQVETRVKFLPKENYQGAGLLIYVGPNEYMRFERAYGGIGGGADGIRIDHRTNEAYTPVVTPADLPTEAPEVDLRIVRTGPTFSAYWRIDEESEWREAGVVETAFPETVFAGLVACNTAREVTVEFGYIKLLPAPWTP